MGDCVVNHPSQQDQEEARWQDKIIQEEGGEKEVETIYGCADIVTDTKIIEIKRADQWKHALGQVLIYGRAFPSKEKWLYLFNGQKEDPLLLATTCATFNVKIKWLE